MNKKSLIYAAYKTNWIKQDRQIESKYLEKKVSYANHKRKKVRVVGGAIFISHKMDFKIKCVTWDKEFHNDRMDKLLNYYKYL